MAAFRDGAGAVLVSGFNVVYKEFSESYDIQALESGDDIILQAKGLVGHDIDWDVDKLIQETT